MRETINQDELYAIASSLDRLANAYETLSGSTPDMIQVKPSADGVLDGAIFSSKRKGIAEGLQHAGRLLREFAENDNTIAQFQLSCKREAGIVEEEAEKQKKLFKCQNG